MKNSKGVEVATEKQGGGNDNNVVASALGGMRYLIFLQIASRIITFVLNILVVREIDTAVFGVFSVQYQLIMATILFLTREGFRRACQRSSINASGSSSARNASQEVAKVMNLAWLSVPLGTIITLGVLFFFSRLASPEELELSNYKEGLSLFALGSFLEILSEPVYILAQNLFLYRTRTLVEGSAVFLRCIVTYFLVVKSGLGLLGFGYAQVFYGLCLILGYYGYFIFVTITSGSSVVTSISQLFPSFRGGLDSHLIGLWGIYEWQSVEKLVLTEGEKFVLWFSASLVDQGIYSVVNNLGSLVARFLFQPVEESCYSLFSKLLANSQDSKDVETSSTVLRVLTKFMILIGLIFITFGPNYSSLLLNMLYNYKFANTGASAVLAWYCVYVAVIALNGITEAFVHAVASPAELRKFNLLLISFSVIYVICATVLVRVIETSGLIFANCINMGLRVTFSVFFIRRFFQKYAPKSPMSFSFSYLLPNKLVLAVLVLAFSVTWVTQKMNPMIHFGAGAFFGSLVIGLVYFSERAFCVELKNLLVRGRAKKE